MDLYLIDTSAWIPALRKGGERKVIEEVSAILQDDLAATCPVIALELLSGVSSGSHFEELRADLNALHKIRITDETWSAACRLGFELRRKGLTAPSTDVLIASAAITAGCVLLHRDKHFDLIAKHSALKSKRI